MEGKKIRRATRGGSTTGAIRYAHCHLRKPASAGVMPHTKSLKDQETDRFIHKKYRGLPFPGTG